MKQSNSPKRQIEKSFILTVIENQIDMTFDVFVNTGFVNSCQNLIDAVSIISSYQWAGYPGFLVQSLED